MKVGAEDFQATSRGTPMKFYLLTAVAAVAIAAPAQARDGQAYFGVEGGVLFAPDHDADVFVDYTTIQAPLVPAIPTAPPGDALFDDGLGLNYKTGMDLDAILGYDFGMFRLEGEFGWKKAKLDELEIDGDLVTGLNAALNRPSAAPDPGAPGLPALIDGDFDLDGKTTVFSAMINALVDFGDEDGLSFYAGVGAGWAKVKVNTDFVDDSDGAWAGQLIAGVRYAISPNSDLGLKYRYFRTGKVHLVNDAVLAIDGNPNRFSVDSGGGIFV